MSSVRTLPSNDAVTVTGVAPAPSRTRSGSTDNVIDAGGSSSSTRISAAARTSSDDVPRTSIRSSISSTASSSGVTVNVPVPCAAPAEIVTSNAATDAKPTTPAAPLPDTDTVTAVSSVRTLPSNDAVTVTGVAPAPSRTRSGSTDNVIDAGATGDWSSKVSLAIGSFENLPVPLMLVIVSRGLVAGLSSANSVPSSVPASYGNRSTCCRGRHCPRASSRDSPETPTNQSGLGAIMATSVTSGWVVVSVTSTVAVGVGPFGRPCSTTVTAFGLALISDLKVAVLPVSATSSIPALAVPPLLQKTTPPSWTAPINGEKCALEITPPGVTPMVHVPSNVTR